MAEQEEEKVTPPVRNYLANLWRMRARVAQQDEGKGMVPRRDKERKKEGGREERGERSGFLRESRTAGRRIKISVNKRLRWS